MVNTPSGKGARTDEGKIRAAAVQAGVPCVTTLEAATAAVKAMEALRDEEMQVQALQDRFATERCDWLKSSVAIGRTRWQTMSNRCRLRRVRFAHLRVRPPLRLHHFCCV